MNTSRAFFFAFVVSTPGCYQPGATSPADETGALSTTSGTLSGETGATSPGSSTGSTAYEADSTGHPPDTTSTTGSTGAPPIGSTGNTSGSSTSDATGSSTGGCIPGVFGEAQFQNACFQ